MIHLFEHLKPAQLNEGTFVSCRPKAFPQQDTCTVQSARVCQVQSFFAYHAPVQEAVRRVLLADPPEQFLLYRFHRPLADRDFCLLHRRHRWRNEQFSVHEEQGFPCFSFRRKLLDSPATLDSRLSIPFGATFSAGCLKSFYFTIQLLLFPCRCYYYLLVLSQLSSFY